MAACAAIKADGTRCKGQAIDNSQWCFSHHPDYDKKRRQRASKGGRRAGRGRPVVEVARLQGRLEELAEGVLDGSLDRADANTAGLLFSYALRAVAVGLKAREVEELEGRLAEVEEALAQRPDSRGGFYAR